MLEQLQQAPPGLLVFIAVVGVVGLLVGFSGLRRYRLIEDVPTARVRSAPQGYVELIGTAAALPGEPIVAPLTQTRCCWFSYRVERRADKGWRTLQSGTSDSLFLLRDETGDCVIDPEGAEVDSSHNQTWYGGESSLGMPGMHRLEREFGLGLRVASRVLSHSGALAGEGYRYHERIILEGDPLYAIGRFHSLDDSDFSESERARMGELLREWKAHPETLRERFDHNRDGIIDQREWEDARAAARRRAKEELAGARSHTHVHVLRKPPSRLFLIANRDEPIVVKRLRWRARIGLGLFGLALLIDTLALAGKHLG
jgi:hypothetical protein